MKNKYRITATLNRVMKRDGTDTFYALVAHETPLLISDICEDIAEKKGNAVKAKTLEKNVNLVFLKVMKEILSGNVVNMGNYSVELCVRGEFDSVGDVFDRTRHGLTLKIVPNETLVREFDKVGVTTITNEKPCSIFWLRNKRTNSLWGLFVPGDILIVDGCGLVIAGEDKKVGVYLINADTRMEIKVSGDAIGKMTEAQLEIAITDNIPRGRYYVKVVTQYDDLDETTTDKINEAVSPRTIGVNGMVWIG